MSLKNFNFLKSIIRKRILLNKFILIANFSYYFVINLLKILYQENYKINIKIFHKIFNRISK